MTFNEFWPKYIERKRLLVKQTTLAAYNLTWRSHLKEFFGLIEIASIKTSTLQAYVEAGLHAGKSPKALKDQIMLVKNIIKIWTIDNDAQLKVFPIIWPTEATCGRKKRSKYTDKELTQLVEYAKADSTHFSKLVALLALTGMRVGELCGLRYGDFDYQELTVHTSRTVGRLYIEPGKTDLYVNNPKTASSDRVIPIPKWLSRYFQKYQELFHWKDGDYISAALSDKTPFLEPRTFRVKFYSLCDKAGVPRREPHALRHTYASRLLMAGVDIRTTSELLGHSDVSTTLNVYAHSDEDGKKRAAKKIFI